MKEGRGTNPFKPDVGCNTNELDQTSSMKSPLIQIDNSPSSPNQSWDQSSQSLPYPTTNNNDTTFSSWSSATDTQENSTWDQTSSPLSKSPWSSHLLSIHNESSSAHDDTAASYNRLMGSLVREEGHIYSLAASGDLLYTGSDSKNIRVWKNQREYSGFKSNSGLVKSIVISSLDCRIFTGHQDGKIRVWRMSSKNPSMHKRIGTLPTLKAYIKNSIKPSNYMERSSSKVNRDTLRIKHFDAISSLSLSEDNNFLYSASWDKTIKVWKVSNFKCLESIPAHEDAVNAVVDGFDGLVFTGSADGTVKVWRRELQGRGTKHFFSQCVLRQECAVTALAVNPKAGIVYCGSSDGVVKFWERDKWGSVGGELRGHKLAVLCMATAGNVVFSGSADMGICVWRKEEAKAACGGAEHVLLSVLTGHSGPVKCLAVEKDGESMINDRNWILYSGSLDKSVKMWRISENAPPDRAAAGSMLTSAGQKQLQHQEQKR